MTNATKEAGIRCNVDPKVELGNYVLILRRAQLNSIFSFVLNSNYQLKKIFILVLDSTKIQIFKKYQITNVHS